ncbi:MaoC/PaaZ C-terminal domain-containing protein [Actinomadura sp. BRA 177]|uniref:MaoC/PaaZ C-terminal domain-containing protein n=1 Tax=Actinomadura sp. BRA 177 TaxID=2745202 RepID=UPI001595A5E6|nr:MaoC/PaaZ C-terminal domain-containing protein [Actinomadura sp. BRA 177]NVI87780.1 MaoC family dehydratase N-terminal domain-containing protein [Actinomadura sp. BRA 177]
MSEWRGRDLGTKTVTYDETQAILYALAVGADASDLDLVFEEKLRVLPTFALTLAQWAPDALGSAGAFDVRTAVHGTQRLRVLKPLPRSGSVEMKARVAEVWDKGSAAVFDVAVESEYFEATWSLFAPGSGGFGGERGPSARRRPETAPDGSLNVRTATNQAALYRLLGDRHHLHIDPEAAKTAGMPRPIMHGLCTLAAITLPLAASQGVHPADLRELEGRFAAPVFPGDELNVETWKDGGATTLFEAAADDRTVISAGLARFA